MADEANKVLEGRVREAVIETGMGTLITAPRQFGPIAVGNASPGAPEGTAG